MAGNRSRKTVGLIGAGALAGIFCAHFGEVLGERFRLCGVYSRTQEKASRLASAAGAAACSSLEELLALRPDVVVEFAGGDALREYGEAVLRSGSDLAAASVGALADEAFRARLVRAAEESGATIRIPCGALGGLDLMRMAALCGRSSLEFTTSKPPRGLSGAPGLAGRELSPEETETVFRGSVDEAIRGFPKNVNVAVAASLAAQPGSMEVRICSRPGLSGNEHLVRLENEAVEMEMRVRAKPDPRNPKSSVTAAWSMLAMLDSLAGPVAFF